MLRPNASRISRVATNYDSKALANLSNRVEISGGVPAKKRMVLKYDQFNGYATGAAIRRQVFRANSLFDPDFTGTGAQPYNFDDWSTFYNRYRVHACGIRVTAASNVAPTQNWGVVVCPSNASTSIAPADMIASPGAKSAALGASYTSGLPAVLELHSTTQAALGELVREGLQAQVTASPADIWFYHIVIFSDDGVDTSWAGYLKVEMFFDVEFYDRNSLTLDFLVRRHKLATAALKRHLLRLQDEKSDELLVIDQPTAALLTVAIEERARAARKSLTSATVEMKEQVPVSTGESRPNTIVTPAATPGVNRSAAQPIRSGYFFA